MEMHIYKITNKINNKVYIGQVSNKSIQKRFERHIGGADPKSPMYICRAIYKYGKENFDIEEIDTANTKAELNAKEKYWINVYNSTNRNFGYNLTPGGDGGNTYLNKTKEEMNLIKKKISKSNHGENNGMSIKIKCKDILTNNEYLFDTITDCLSFLGIKNKGVITLRCKRKESKLFRNRYMLAFQNDDYNPNYHEYVHDRSLNKGEKVEVINLTNNHKQIFNSINKTCEFFGTHKGKLKIPKNGTIVYENYSITRLGR